jgi:hypothetical protein
MTDEKNLKKIDSPNVELPKVNESLKENSFPIDDDGTDDCIKYCRSYRKEVG